MAMTMKKKLFKHGGSYAMDVPMDFVRQNASSKNEVLVESHEGMLIVHGETELDTIESEPQFSHFIRAIAEDAMRNPDKLKTAKDVWDKEWDELLKDVSNGD
jgi:hypothetical protein